jgi:hypothetical protein
MNTFTRVLIINDEKTDKNKTENIDINNLQPSSYEPKTTLELLQKLSEINPDCWLLCPHYSSKNGESLDTQFVVTGKCKYDEEYQNAVVREINEELAINVAKQNIVFINRNININKSTKPIKSIETQYYHVSIDDANNITNDIINEYSRDDKTKHIMSVVYANDQDLALELVQNINKTRYLNESINNIDIIHISIAISSLIKLIKNNKN